MLDGLGRVVSSFLPGEGVASVKVDYRDANPFIVHTQTRDDKDDGGAATYHHSWQIYNGLGQVIESQSEVEGDGAKIALTASSYNALGQPEKTLLPYESANGGNYIDPDWNQLYNEVFYDSLGRPVKSVAPGNRVTQTGYYGRKTATLDPKNHLTTTEVDNLGRTISARVFEGSRSLGAPGDYYAETKFQYDHLDRLLTTTDTLGNTTTLTYNQAGQKISSDDPDLGLWRYTYDPVGTLATTTDAKGQVTRLEYDDLNRVTKKYFGNTLAASFGYDNCQKGQLCSDETHNQDINTSTAYSYDEKGRLVSEEKTIGGASYTTGFAYDASGRQREITYPDGEKVSYAYNDVGLLENVTGDETYLASADYNTLGLPEEEVLGNQTKNIYTYEPQTYRLDTKTVKDSAGVGLWSQNLDYDPVGNITSINYPLENLINTYSYDDLNRLTEMTTTDEEFFANYDYDVLGRMTLKTEEGGEEEPPACVPGKENPDLPGDLDCDCRVTVGDIMKVAVIWNTKEGDEKFNSDYDFREPYKKVDIADIMYIAARWDTRCSE